MEHTEVLFIPLHEIRPAPWNPPSRLAPEKVRELADSIQVEGQQSPALVRPVEADPPVKYEVVWGHRRYAAQRLLMERTGEVRRLKTFVQEMDQEQAIISSGIENLQREDFTDLEEAEFLKTASERYGAEGVKVLSEKFSISDRYIRKRIEFLRLPEPALLLWKEGVWGVGHLEQLLRIGDDGEILDLIEYLVKHNEADLPVWELKEKVDSLAVPLHSGHFDKKECKTCRKNTDCQRQLFDLDTEKTKCLNAGCFTKKEQAWLDLNWATCKMNKYGTQAAIIGSYNTDTTGEFNWSTKPSEKCKTCPHFTTIWGLGREWAYRDQVCMGDSNCFAQVKKSGESSSSRRNGNGKGDGPRVAWHGEHFRQRFYQQEVPRLMGELNGDDPRRLQMALATIVYSAKTIHEWFCQKFGVELKKTYEFQSHASTSFPAILELTKSLDAFQAERLLAEALVMIALRADRGYETTFSDKDRQAVAEFLDVDFGRFAVDEEYLNKKTKPELVRFIVHESGLMEVPEFQAYLSGQGLPVSEPEKLAQLKKGSLVNLIQNCGVDLHGRLPKEVADLPEIAAEAACEEDDDA